MINEMISAAYARITVSIRNEIIHLIKDLRNCKYAHNFFNFIFFSVFFGLGYVWIGEIYLPPYIKLSPIFYVTSFSIFIVNLLLLPKVWILQSTIRDRLLPYHEQSFLFWRRFDIRHGMAFKLLFRKTGVKMSVF